jgi:hypothetical protein
MVDGWDNFDLNFKIVIPPTVDVVTIDSGSIRADGTTQYTITNSSSDLNGVGNIRYLRTLVNYQGSNAGSYRGYFIWSSGTLGGSWIQQQSCSGGGYAYKYNGYGAQYVDLVSCSTSTLGNQRTANFDFHANTNWGSDGPLSNNDISGHVEDQDGLTDGWNNSDLNFAVLVPPVVDSVGISADPILADGSTTYTITISSSDGNGVANLNDMRALINYQGSNAGSYRGYFRWDDSDFSASWPSGQFVACSGGGYGGKYTGSSGGGYGKDYVDFVSCSTSTLGNQRTVNFVFHANTNWGTDGPLSSNTISGWVQDDDGYSSGWQYTGFSGNVFAVTPNFGGITGYVWDDTANRNCVFDAGETKLSGRTIVATGPSNGSDVTNGSGDYTISGLNPSVNPNDYTVSVDLPTVEWKKVCPTNDGTLSESVTLDPGETQVVNFGLEYAPSAWYQATWSVNGINGDIHSNGNISIPVPSGQFLVDGSGLVSAGGAIITGLGGASASTWNIPSYSNIPWPTALIDSVTGDDLSGTVKVKYYPADLTISTTHADWAAYFNSPTPVIVVAPNITVAADVGDDPGSTTNRINAILIAKNNFTVDDSVGNKMLNIKGAVIAQTITINRELDDNTYPAMKTEFDPQYFAHNVPYFTQAIYAWEEVK